MAYRRSKKNSNSSKWQHQEKTGGGGIASTSLISFFIFYLFPTPAHREKYNEVSLVMRSGGRCDADEPSGNARPSASCIRWRSCARCGGW